MARQRVLVCGHGEEMFMHDLLIALDTELPRGSEVRPHALISLCFMSQMMRTRQRWAHSCQRSPKKRACASSDRSVSCVARRTACLQMDLCPRKEAPNYCAAVSQEQLSLSLRQHK